MISELANTIAQSPISHLFVWPTIFWLFAVRRRIPEEAKWNHDYEIPRESYLPRKGIYPVALLGLQALVILVALVYVPSDLDSAINWFSSIPEDSPYLIAVKIAFINALILEAIFAAVILGSLFNLAQSMPDVSDLPWWAVSLGWLLVSLAGLALEIFSLPVTFWAAFFVFLFSFSLLIGGSWLTWSSFPDNPLRIWFCTWIAPNIWTPYTWLWSLVGRCWLWGLDTWLETEARWAHFVIESTITAYNWVLRTIKIPIVQAQRIIRQVKIAVAAIPPGVLKSIAGFLIDTFDLIVDVVEWVVVVVWTFISFWVVVLIVFPIWLVVAILMLNVFLVIKLVCLFFTLVAIGWSFALLLWLTNVGLLRLYFLN